MKPCADRYVVIIWTVVIDLSSFLVTVAVIIAMSGSMAIAFTLQRRWQRRFGNGIA